MDTSLLLLFAVMAIASLLLNFHACYVILRSDSYSNERKALQILLIWLIPLVGASICLMFVRTDNLRTPTARPQEFYDNAGEQIRCLEMNEMPFNDVHAAMQAVDNYVGQPEMFMLAISDSLLDSIGINMAMITDRILARDWEPDGYDQHTGFRVYRFKLMT